MQTLLTSNLEQIDALLGNINKMLVDLENYHQQAISYLQRADTTLISNCEQLTEDIGGYLPKVYVQDLLEDLMTQLPLSITLPVIGKIDINESYLNRYGGLETMVSKQLDNYDYTKFIEMTQVAIDECQNSVTDIGNRTLQLNDRIQENNQELRVLSSDIIQYLTELELRTTPRIQQFAALLRNNLQLDFEVEITMDTSNDEIISEAIALCDNPNTAARQRLLNIATQIGITNVQGATAKQICNRIVNQL